MHDPNGSMHLHWILRFQLALLPLGATAWAFKSLVSAVFFLAAGIIGLLFWQVHKWTVVRMLTPSKKQRWFYALIGLSKLALITVLLRVTIECFPMEVLPVATGFLLFVVAILLEATRLAVCHIRSAGDD